MFKTNGIDMESQR